MRRVKCILVFCFILLLFACDQNRRGNHLTADDAKTAIDSAGTMQEIKWLGDLVYDSPTVFLRHQDSLMDMVNKITTYDKGGANAYQLLLLNIGYVFRRDAQILKSIGVYEKALESYYRQPDTGINFLEYYVKPLGSLYTMTGDLQKAVVLQYMALNNVKGSDEEKSSIYANLAITIKQLQLYDSVIAICHKGLGYTKKNSVTAARHYNELASCFLALNDVDSATFYNQFALNILTQPRKRDASRLRIVWEANARSIQGQISFLKGNYDNALQGLSKALNLLETYFPGSHRRERAKLWELRANLFSKQGNFERAKKEYQSAIALLKTSNKSIYPDYTITDSYFGLGDCYSHTGQKDSAIRYYLLSLLNDYAVQQFITTKKSSYYNSAQSRHILKAVSVLLYQQIRQTDDKDKRQQYAFQLLWATELSKGRQLMNEISRTRSWTSNGNISQQILKAQNQLRYLYESLAKIKSQREKERIRKEINDVIYKTSLSENAFEKHYRLPDFATFIQKIKELSQSADVVSWQMNAVGENYVVTVSKEIPSVHKIGESKKLRAGISSFLNQYFYNGPQAYNNNPALYFKESENVLDSILPQHQQCVQSTWVTSPDGMLYGLSLEALSHDHRFLIQDKTIKAVYTLLSYRTESDVFTKEMKVDLFAKAKHKAPFSDLRYIPKEINEIKSCVATKVYEDGNANLKNLEAALKTNNILHISTHAVADSGRQPYLVFDKQINLDKLQYVMTKAPLVVLSACETAKGKTILGEGMESLNKTFLSKGIKGVIAAQWTIDDAFIPDFMKQFYTLLKKEKDPAVALRDAKLHFINNNSNRLGNNPWVWASMSYTGENIRINLKDANSRFYMLYSLLGLGFAGLFVFYLSHRKKRKSRQVL